jgi:hypothetical protein
MKTITVSSEVLAVALRALSKAEFECEHSARISREAAATFEASYNKEKLLEHAEDQERIAAEYRAARSGIFGGVQ